MAYRVRHLLGTSSQEIFYRLQAWVIDVLSNECCSEIRARKCFIELDICLEL
jgi:hypothetical protein